MSGVITGMVMAFTLSLDDFIISYFCSGTTQTLPVFIYSMTKKREPGDQRALHASLRRDSYSPAHHQYSAGQDGKESEKEADV